MAKPMKQGPTSSRGRNIRMQIMKNNSTATSSRPTLMPERSGMHERGERIALERGEGGAGVGDGVDADAEPGHAVGAEDAENGGEQDDDDVAERCCPESTLK